MLFIFFTEKGIFFLVRDKSNFMQFGLIGSVTCTVKICPLAIDNQQSVFIQNPRLLFDPTVTAVLLC